MKTFQILSTVFLLIVFGKIQAQADDLDDAHTVGITIPSVAIVDIEPAASKSLTMAYTAPTEAGLPIVAPTDNSTLWLNYSYIPTATGKTAAVAVKIDAVVPGLDMNVKAGAQAGTGKGTFGQPAGSFITLTNANQTIITGIGASYTGDGASNGHNLTYSLNATGGTSTYANLIASTTNVTVTYTIAEN